MATIAKRNVIFKFVGDNQQLNKSIDQTEKKVGGLSNVFQQAAGTFAGVFAFEAVQRFAGGIQQLAGNAVNLAISAEQTQVAFETFLGSASKARDVIAQLNEFSELTPFEPEQVISAGQSLLAFGIEAEDLTGTLQKLGDISAGTGTDFNELAQIFGKAKVQGRLFGEDINQLTGRGIPIIGEFAKQFGVAESEVKKLVTAGKIGFPELEKAFTDLTSEGGKFFDLTAKQSETLGGKISTLKGVFDAFLRDLGERLVPTLKVVTQGLIDFFSAVSPESILRFVKAIGIAIASFVSYKTAVQLATVSTRTFLRGLVRARAAMRAFNTAVRANPLGVLVTVLTAAASAFVLFSDDADEATESQNEFNKSVAEGNRLLGAVEDIERRVATRERLSKQQLESLASDIESEIRLNQEKNAQLIANEGEFNKSLEMQREEARTLRDQGLITDAEFQERFFALSQKTAVDNETIRQEGITNAQTEGNQERLNELLKLVQSQISITQNGGKGLTDEEKKILKERAKLAEDFRRESVSKLDNERAEDLEKQKQFLDDQQQQIIDAQNKLSNIPPPDFVALPEEVIDDEVEAVIRGELAKQAAIEETRKKQLEANKKILAAAEQLSAAVIGAAKDTVQGQIDALDKRIEAQKTALSDALTLTRDASSEQIEIEEQRLEDLQAQRQRAAAQFRVIAQVEAVAAQALAVSKGILAVTEAFASPDGNLATGIATSIALAATIAGAIASLNQAFTEVPAFAEGTERVTGPGGPTSDSITARLSAGERVVPTGVNNKYFDTLNEFQYQTPKADLLHSIAKGDIQLPQVAKERMTAKVGGDNTMINELKLLNKKMDKLDISVKLDKEGFATSITTFKENQNRFKKKAGL